MSATAGPAESVVGEVGQGIRAPWAASLAGILFAVLFTVALVLLRSSPLTAANDAELLRLFADGRDTWVLAAGLYLAPFAGIMFLWFVAVVRDQVGDREDKFFATVFFGSALLFVALLFAGVAVATAPIVGVRYLGLDPPTAAEMGVARALAYTLVLAYATRAAAVFLISMSTLGLRTGTFPGWLSAVGLTFGAVLFFVVSFWDWIILLLPAWVAVISLFILRRERGRTRARRAAHA